MQIRAAEREFQRAKWAWDKGAIPERDLKAAEDDRESAKLTYDNAMETAGLEQESLDLDLRARQIERERQGYVVANLKRRVDELTRALAGRTAWSRTSPRPRRRASRRTRRS